jgi:hypothetical protein
MSDNPFLAARAPNLFGFPAQEPPVGLKTGATLSDTEAAPFVVPPLLPHPDLAQELLPPKPISGAVMPDEKVGVTTEPFYAAQVGSYLNTYNPYPVQVPPTLADIAEKKV